MRRRSGEARVLLGGMALVALISWAWIATRPQSVEVRQRAADTLVAGIRATVTVEGDRLLAARAIADFGVGGEVRLVRVRIVDELRLEVQVDVTNDVDVATITACLVGPDAAPDDAGLSDRCWGAADLGTKVDVMKALASVAGGRSRLAAGSAASIAVVVGRGDAGCDYPPGTWRLELLVDPIVGGAATGPRYAPDATFEVPFERDEPLHVVEERRYCGLASKVYLEQGEPPLLAAP